jgi:hypothetical protein
MFVLFYACFFFFGPVIAKMRCELMMIHSTRLLLNWIPGFFCSAFAFLLNLISACHRQADIGGYSGHAGSRLRRVNLKEQRIVKLTSTTKKKKTKKKKNSQVVRGRPVRDFEPAAALFQVHSAQVQAASHQDHAAPDPRAQAPAQGPPGDRQRQQVRAATGSTWFWLMFSCFFFFFFVLLALFIALIISLK